MTPLIFTLLVVAGIIAAFWLIIGLTIFGVAVHQNGFPEQADIDDVMPLWAFILLVVAGWPYTVYVMLQGD